MKAKITSGVLLLAAVVFNYFFMQKLVGADTFLIVRTSTLLHGISGAMLSFAATLCVGFVGWAALWLNDYDMTVWPYFLPIACVIAPLLFLWIGAVSFEWQSGLSQGNCLAAGVLYACIAWQRYPHDQKEEHFDSVHRTQHQYK